MFINQYKMPHPCKKLSNKGDTYVRPAHTGYRYQYIDLSNITKEGVCYKGERFDFTNLSNCVFTNCDFSRCIFINANLDNCMFIQCNFIGEQTTFYKATGTPIFIECSTEWVNIWKQVTDSKSVRECLVERCLDSFEVYNVDANGEIIDEDTVVDI
jgi:hypothetical protein